MVNKLLQKEPSGWLLVTQRRMAKASHLYYIPVRRNSTCPEDSYLWPGSLLILIRSVHLACLTHVVYLGTELKVTALLSQTGPSRTSAGPEMGSKALSGQNLPGRHSC